MQLQSLLAGAAALVLSGFALAPEANAQGAQPGWNDTAINEAAAFTGRATLSDGRIVSFDGQIVNLVSADGVTTTQLHDFGTFSFSGILVPSLDETFAIVGESSNGDVFIVDLVAGGATFLANIPFNFSAVWEDANNLVISAGAPTFTDNNVIRLDVTTGTQTLLAMVPGPSGPIGIDSLGNVYLALIPSGFPAPPAMTDIVVFPAPALTGSPLLSEFDGQPVGLGFDGASSLIVDDLGLVYLCENNFGAGTNRIWAVNGSAVNSELLYEGPSGDWVTFDRFDAGTGPGIFAGYQPAISGRILCERTDFGTFDERFDLTPQRPEMTAVTSVVGTGVGFTLDVTDGRPNSPVILAYAATPAPGTPEIAAIPSALPLLTAFDLNTLQVFPFPLLLDGNGEFSVSFATGSITGISFQGLMLDDDFIGVATTTRADL
ncbi:MAG: hypothetical protein ACYS26_03660 [Planctomycetota bacterium]|jgi:hypothetical protein